MISFERTSNFLLPVSINAFAQDPTITCKAEMSFDVAKSADIDVNQIVVAADDNCPGFKVVLESPTRYGCYDIGVQKAKAFIQDASEFGASCETTVVVSDDTVC